MLPTSKENQQILYHTPGAHRRHDGDRSADDVRFWLTLDHAVDLVLRSVEEMEGGEVFVPKIPSMRITDLARAIAPKALVKRIGMAGGEAARGAAHRRGVAPRPRSAVSSTSWLLPYSDVTCSNLSFPPSEISVKPSSVIRRSVTIMTQ